VQDDTIQINAVTGDSVTQTFTMLDDLHYSWLVAGGSPTAITMDDAVWWHPLSSSLTMDGWPDKGDGYTVTSTYANPTPDELRAQGVGPVDPADLQLPTDVTIPAVVAETAQRWTQDAQKPYDKVMAIMHHLRGPSFTYDANVDLQDNPQALADFLHDRRGFCQQFAGLMAVMLRSLGIPARVGLGFTQGEPVANETGTYIVHGHDYHSWVEVPFNGYGWLTFDPTPQFSDPASLTYAAGTTTIRCVPGQGHNCGNLHPGPGGKGQNAIDSRVHVGDVKAGITNRLQGGDTNAPQTRTLGGLTLSDVVLAAVALALLVAVGIPVWHGIRRRRRLRVAHDPRTLVLATYDVFTDRAKELGVGRSPGDTPDEFRRKLAATDTLDGAEEPLLRMTAEVVRAAYAPDGPDATVAAAVRHDADEVLHALRAATPWRQRVVGRYRQD